MMKSSNTNFTSQSSRRKNYNDDHYYRRISVDHHHENDDDPSTRQRRSSYRSDTLHDDDCHLTQAQNSNNQNNKNIIDKLRINNNKTVDVVDEIIDIMSSSDEVEDDDDHLQQQRRSLSFHRNDSAACMKTQVQNTNENINSNRNIDNNKNNSNYNNKMNSINVEIIEILSSDDEEDSIDNNDNDDKLSRTIQKSTVDTISTTTKNTTKYTPITLSLVINNKTNVAFDEAFINNNDDDESELSRRSSTKTVLSASKPQLRDINVIDETRSIHETLITKTPIATITTAVTTMMNEPEMNQSIKKTFNVDDENMDDDDILDVWIDNDFELISRLSTTVSDKFVKKPPQQVNVHNKIRNIHESPGTTRNNNTSTNDYTTTINTAPGNIVFTSKNNNSIDEKSEKDSYDNDDMIDVCYDGDSLSTMSDIFDGNKQYIFNDGTKIHITNCINNNNDAICCGDAEPCETQQEEKVDTIKPSSIYCCDYNNKKKRQLGERLELSSKAESTIDPRKKKSCVEMVSRDEDSKDDKDDKVIMDACYNNNESSNHNTKTKLLDGNNSKSKVNDPSVHMTECYNNEIIIDKERNDRDNYDKNALDVVVDDDDDDDGETSFYSAKLNILDNYNNSKTFKSNDGTHKFATGSCCYNKKNKVTTAEEKTTKMTTDEKEVLNNENLSNTTATNNNPNKETSSTRINIIAYGKCSNQDDDDDDIMYVWDNHESSTKTDVLDGNSNSNSNCINTHKPAIIVFDNTTNMNNNMIDSKVPNILPTKIDCNVDDGNNNSISNNNCMHNNELITVEQRQTKMFRESRPLRQRITPREAQEKLDLRLFSREHLFSQCKKPAPSIISHHNDKNKKRVASCELDNNTNIEKTIHPAKKSSMTVSKPDKIHYRKNAVVNKKQCCDWDKMFRILIEHIRHKKQRSSKNKLDNTIDELDSCSYRWDGYVHKEYKTKDGIHLGSWVHWQRTVKRRGTLQVDRERKLTNIGILWNPRLEAWNAMFESLQEYIVDQRDIGNDWDGSVPNHYCTPRNPSRSLGRWVRQQRSRFSNNTLSNDLIEKLNSIGFKWNSTRDNDSFHGKDDPLFKHVSSKQDKENEPQPCNGKNDIKLATKNCLEWEKMFQILVAFIHQKRKNETDNKAITGGSSSYQWDGHVPNAYKTEDGISLGNWVKTQRIARRRGILNPDRERKLISIGLSWNPRLTTTKRRTDGQNKQRGEGSYRKVLEMDNNNVENIVNQQSKKTSTRNTNCCVPFGKDKLLLSTNISTATSKNAPKPRIGKDNVALLKKHFSEWEKMFQILVEFIHEKRKNETDKITIKEGNSYQWVWDGNVSKEYVTKDGICLGRWIETQRLAKKQGILNVDRERKLMSIGLSWNPTWDTMFQSLQEYISEQQSIGNDWDGHVPNNYRTHHNPARLLGFWVQKQKYKYFKKILNAESIEKLNSIGFQWNFTSTATTSRNDHDNNQGDDANQNVASLKKHTGIEDVQSTKTATQKENYCNKRMVEDSDQKDPASDHHKNGLKSREHVTDRILRQRSSILSLENLKCNNINNDTNLDDDGTEHIDITKKTKKAKMQEAMKSEATRRNLLYHKKQLQHFEQLEYNGRQLFQRNKYYSASIEFGNSGTIMKLLMLNVIHKKRHDLDKNGNIVEFTKNDIVKNLSIYENVSNNGTASCGNKGHTDLSGMVEKYANCYCKKAMCHYKDKKYLQAVTELNKILVTDDNIAPTTPSLNQIECQHNIVVLPNDVLLTIPKSIQADALYQRAKANLQISISLWKEDDNYDDDDDDDIDHDVDDQTDDTSSVDYFDNIISSAMKFQQFLCHPNESASIIQDMKAAASLDNMDAILWYNQLQSLQCNKLKRVHKTTRSK